MPPLKLEVLPLPDFREEADGLWFTAKTDSHDRWEPMAWRPRPTNSDIVLLESVLNDPDLSSIFERSKRLSEISGKNRTTCAGALRARRWEWWVKYVSITRADFKRQLIEPTPCSLSVFWLYRDRLVIVTNGDSVDELALRIKHKVLSHERALEKLKHEVEAFENFTRLQGVRREAISEEVRMFVWQRDAGRCAKCGSQQRLEYDHIIAVAKGGSSTERNVQLLCETCNRSKGSGLS